MKTKYTLQRRDDGTLGLRADDDSSATRTSLERASGFATRSDEERPALLAPRSSGERGSALIPALMIVSMVAMLGLSMLSAGASGSKVTTGQADDYKLTSAVESVGTLAAENLWSAYLRNQGGAAGTIQTFRAYLNGVGIADSGPGGPPTANEGVDLTAATGIPLTLTGDPEFDDVLVDALRVIRRDEGESTRLYLTVAATTQRGTGVASKPLARAIQLVYTIEPAPFEGFDYGILTKNVNCVFCHTVIDSAERAYNHDPSLYDSFAKVKVGTLESLMLRADTRPTIGDDDADSVIAGSLYVRGDATNQHGVPLSNWAGNLAMHSCAFDENGHLVEDDWGSLSLTSFSPASAPFGPGENLYLNYPTAYSEMPDGKLPVTFPPPFPDDGGIDPATGEPTATGAGNQVVDPSEFFAVAKDATGMISGGTIYKSSPGEVIDDPAEHTAAFYSGNMPTLPSGLEANVVLTGTKEHPIKLNGTVAIDGDVVISGWIQGKGTILASGNVYIPASLQYKDGLTYVEGDEPGSPSGPQTFGIDADSQENVLGLAAGGNLMIGDVLAPSTFLQPGSTGVVTGDSTGQWNFALAEISLFNRTEWAHTQPKLPAQGEDHSNPATWTAVNPYFIPDYVPHYYHFGPGDEIPIYNLGETYFDTSTGTWHGPEVPLGWDPNVLTIVDPDDTTSPLLYDQVTGEPKAAILQTTPHDGWITDDMLKLALDQFSAQHEEGTPVQIDGLLYTNHALFGIVPRNGPAKGQLEIGGSIVCADLGLLAPGYKVGSVQPGNVPGSPFKVGLRLNYDKRTKGMLNVANPNSVTIKRTLWNPTAHVL